MKNCIVKEFRPIKYNWFFLYAFTLSAEKSLKEGKVKKTVSINLIKMLAFKLLSSYRKPETFSVAIKAICKYTC